MDSETKRGQSPFMWYVMFCDRPYNTLLQRGFRHVWVLGYQPYTQNWLIIDHHGVKCDFLVLTKEAGFSTLKSLDSDITCLSMHENIQPGRMLSWGLISCVEITKRILGINAPWAFTPLQLYRHIRAHAPHSVIKTGEIDNGSHETRQNCAKSSN